MQKVYCSFTHVATLSLRSCRKKLFSVCLIHRVYFLWVLKINITKTYAELSNILKLKKLLTENFLPDCFFPSIQRIPFLWNFIENLSYMSSTNHQFWFIWLFFENFLSIFILYLFTVCLILWKHRIVIVDCLWGWK